MASDNTSDAPDSLAQETTQGKPSSQCDPAQENGGRQASRLLLTGLFALLGAKLAAFVATHVMMGKQVLHAAQKNLNWEQRIKRFLNLGDALGSGKDFKRNLIITGVSMAVGTLAGAVMGHVRGHRIKKPKDIIEHPIKTLKTIVMSEEKYQAQERAECEQTSTAWRDKTHQPSESQHVR